MRTFSSQAASTLSSSVSRVRVNIGNQCLRNTSTNNKNGAHPTDGAGSSVEDWLKSFPKQDELRSSNPKLSPKAQSKFNYLVDRMPSEMRESIAEARTGISDSMSPDKLTGYQRKLVLERFSQAASARVSTRIEDTVKEDPMGAQRLGVRLSDEDPNKQASSDLEATISGDLSSIENPGSTISENGANSWHNAANILMDMSIPPFIRDEIMEEIVAARGKRGGGGQTQHDVIMEDLVRLQGDLEMDANTNGDVASSTLSTSPEEMETHRNLKETFSNPIVVPHSKTHVNVDEDYSVLGNPGHLHEVGKRLKVANVAVPTTPHQQSPSSTSSTSATKLSGVAAVNGNTEEDENVDDVEDFVQGIRWSGTGNIDAFTHPPQPPLSARKRMIEEEEAEKAKNKDRVIDFADLKPLE